MRNKRANVACVLSCPKFNCPSCKLDARYFAKLRRSGGSVVDRTPVLERPAGSVSFAERSSLCRRTSPHICFLMLCDHDWIGDLSSGSANAMTVGSVRGWVSMQIGPAQSSELAPGRYEEGMCDAGGITPLS
jgi:hypothetical protein